MVRNACITEGDPEERLWCSVQVDGRGDHVTGKRRWGHCDCSIDNIGGGRRCSTVSELHPILSLPSFKETFVIVFLVSCLAGQMGRITAAVQKCSFCHHNAELLQSGSSKTRENSIPKCFRLSGIPTLYVGCNDVRANASFQKSGPVANAPCVFPFILGKATHRACTTDSAPDGVPWCSTKTDSAAV